MEIIWDQLDRADWTAALHGGDAGPLQQSWDYGAGMAALGARVRRCVVRDASGDLAMVQVMERRGLRVIARGPVWLRGLDGARKRGVLRGLARHPGLTVATPGEELQGVGLIPLITRRHHALWDLTPDPIELRAGLDGKWRGHLSLAERRGLRISQGGAQALEALIAAEAAQRAVRGYHALPGAFARGWPVDQRHVWQWRQGGQMQAGMLFLRHGDWASYHHGWTGDAGRAVFAHGPMLWQAMLDLRAQGVRMLDLGCLDAANPGLANFKRGTGAAVVPLGATSWVLPRLLRD